jgi:thiamine-phosphate pyrophosphorylase
VTLPFSLLLISDGTGPIQRALEAIDERVAARVAVLVRDKAAAPDVVRARCEALRAGHASVRLLVHTHAEIARSLNLLGVHVADGAPAPDLGGAQDRVCGGSRHADATLDDSDLAGLDFALLGPVFEPLSKAGSGATLGIAGLAERCRRASRPVVAVGGITADNAGACRAAGAAGVAVIGSVLHADDPAEAVRALLEALER